MHLTLENLHLYCDEEGDCLLWNLGMNSANRPIARLDGKTRDVARYLYTLIHGSVPDNCSITRTCGNSRCLACLDAITHSKRNKQSAADRKTANHYQSLFERAKKQGLIKLDLAKVQQIRASEKPALQLAAEYGVSRSTINDIQRRRTWRDTAMSVFNQ